MGKKAKKAKTSTQAQKEAVGRFFQGYMAKAFYASPKDLAMRIPELMPLREKTVAVFGLGCLGAPSALELTRAGVKCIRLVDYDTVDPATTVRWPIGFTAASHKKVMVLRDFIHQNYPYTKCEAFDFKVGAVREADSDQPSDQEVIERIVEGADLVYDSTSEIGVQHFLTDYAWNRRIPYIGLSGTLGGWGGKVFRVRPWSGTGCWYCYRIACDEGTIPEPPSAPEEQGTVQPTGCADPTFTGAGFDMLQIALTGVRMSASTLCEDTANAYPPINWDAVHIRLRSEDGLLIPPSFDTYKIKPHPECPCCRGNSK